MPKVSYVCFLVDVLHFLDFQFILSVTSFLLGALQIVSFFNDRLKVHKDTINLCQDVLRCKFVDWEPVICNNLCHPIHHVDLVITIGGDGTLLQASHFLDDSIPVLGVNSDPTQIKEVSYLMNKVRLQHDFTIFTCFLIFPPAH